MPLFSELDTEWPELVRQIGAGGRIKDLTLAIDDKLNKKLEEEYGIIENIVG